MLTCTFENGNHDSLRHVTVKSIVLNENGQVLLVKRAPAMFRGGKYDLPGGFMDRDENTREGALRELKEETGLTGTIRFLFRINDNPKRAGEDRQNVDFIYVIDATSADIALDHESTDATWFDLDNLPPAEEFAFDHHESLMKYRVYLKEPFDLPIIG